jgi:hypothetical protein
VDSDTAFDPTQLQEKGEGPEPANTQFDQRQLNLPAGDN